MLRSGQGWDRHPLESGRSCVLGGVDFPDCPVGPLGHSDGDALCHAICDALLGAAALGDIGAFFPDTDSRWQGADSLNLLARVVEIVTSKDWVIVNVDSTVITEEPKIAPRSMEMRKTLASTMGLSVDSVSVKATRGEGLGPEGRGECVTVQAVVLLEKK